MMTLARYLQDKDKFSSVVMIRLVYDGKSHDYTRWKFSGQNIFFFDDNMKVSHVLWTTEDISEIDDTHVIINPDNTKLSIGLELFYGGATL
jgi:hypothetical protein